MSLIDPKKVELSIYKNCEQVKEIANNLEESKELLKNKLLEIDTRYKLLEAYNCRNIDSYNKKTYIKMPYKLIVIDELTDLILQDRQNQISNRKNPLEEQSLESLLCRIAQIGRACGVHLIVATQRPSSDVITGLIKANIPSRVAFSVSTRIDSRVILDTKGAEKLTGKGDMLFKMVGNEELQRLQGAYISDEEIEKVVNENTRHISIQSQLQTQKAQQNINEEKETEEQRNKKNEIILSAIGQWFKAVIYVILGSIIPLLVLFFLSQPVFWLMLIFGIGSIIYGLYYKIKKDLDEYKDL